MWTPQLVKEMFPTNCLPSDYTDATSLLYGQPYERVGTRELKMARNMMHTTEEISWYPDGSKIINVLYDVYPFPKVNGVPCLNVYGGKMVQNWLQLDTYAHIRNPKTMYSYFRPVTNNCECNTYDYNCNCNNNEAQEGCCNAGFNYTGL